MVPLLKNLSRANAVIACPPLLHSPNPGGAMAPPLLKSQKSTLLNKLSEFNCAQCAQALPLRKSSNVQNVPQPTASADQNVPQHQMVTFEVVKRFIDTIIFTKTPWPILTGDKYSLVEEAWTLAIEAQDCQWALAGTPVGTPSVCQLWGGPSLQIDPRT